MQRTKVAFYLYLVENVLNVVLALVLVHPLGVRGLALSLSIAYTVAAVLAAGGLPPVVRSPGRAPDLGAAARASSWPRCPWAWSCSWCPTSRVRRSVIGLLARVVGAALAGGLTFAAVVVWLGRRHDGRRRPPPVQAPSPFGPLGGAAGLSRRLGPVAAAPVADSVHARRPHRDRQRLRPDRPARQGAQRRRRAADHPLRRRGVRGPSPAHPGGVLGALPRQGRPARDGGALPRRVPGRLPAGGRRGGRGRAVPDHLLQGVGDLRVGSHRGATPSAPSPCG